MSVAMLVEYPGLPTELLPIATEDVFQNYWQEASKRLGLRWVPLFQGGIAIACDDIGEVVRELEALRGWFAEHGRRDISDFCAKRIDVVVARLRILESDPKASIWIG